MQLTKIYEGANLIAPNNKVIYIPILVSGTLRSIDLIAEVSSGSAVFNVALNDVDVFTGGDRPTTTDAVSLVSKTGLNVAVEIGDVVHLQLESVPSSVIAPITLNLNIETDEDGGSTYSIWTGTQSAYDLLTPDSETLYFITE